MSLRGRQDEIDRQARNGLSGSGNRHELLDEAFRAASWQVCIGKQSESNHLCHQQCWRWRSFWRRTLEFRMMREFRQQ